MLVLIILIIPTVSAAENITITTSDSIQTTINQVEDESIINIMPGKYNQWGITINKNLTFIGNGSCNNIILNAQDNAEIFKIIGGATVKFYNITFKNGHGYNNGGAITIIQSKAYIINCNFNQNFAFENGGAIANSGNSKNYGYLYIANCVFTNNYADHDGGAISSYWGQTEIYNSTFKYNNVYRNGGAIKNGDSSTTKIYNCIFENNYAKNWGGAIYDWPANTAEGKIEIYGCTINNNNCGEYGGGLYFSSSPIIKNSTITNNNAGEYGGAIAIDEKSLYNDPIEIEGNLIFNNTANKNHQDIYIKYCTQSNIFDKNYWGTDDPINGTNYPFKWEERINTYEKSSIIQIWLTSDEIIKTDILIPENKPNISNNSSINSYANNTTNIEGNDTNFPYVKYSVNNKNNSNNNLKLSLSSEKSIKDISKNPSTIKKIIENSKKEISMDNLIYLTLILVFLILIVGYYKLKK